MPTYTEVDLRGYIYKHLLSIQKEKELTREQTQKALICARDVVYEYISPQPDGWKKGEYLAIFWHGESLEIFSIHRAGLKRLVDKPLFNPLLKKQ